MPTLRDFVDDAALARALLEEVPVVVLAIGADGLLSYANPHFYAITGWSPDELIGRDAIDALVPERDRARVRRVVSATIEGRPTRGNTNPVCTADGREIPLEWYDRTLRSGDTAVGVLAIGVDISERVAHDATLERHATFLLGVNDAVIITDLDGAVTEFSPSAETMTGFAATDVIGGHVGVLCPDVDWTAAGAGPGRDGRRLETLLRCAAGRSLVVDMRLRTIVDATGTPVGIAGYCTDVTDRHEAEAALRASELRYRTLVEEARDPIVTIDLDGAFTSVNAAFAQLVGREREELTGTPVSTLVPRGHLDRVRVDMQSKLRGESELSVFTQEFESASGTIVTLEISMQLASRIGEPTGFLAICRDITERRRQEAVVRESSERLRSVVENAMDGIVTIDDEQRILVFNRAAERMFGWSREDIIGRPLEILLPDRYRGVHRDHVGQYATDASSSRPMGIGLRLTGLRSDGTEFPIEAVISRNVTRERTLLLVFIRDISEAERNRELQARLEEQLADSRRLEAIGTLASGIAHDFNNILGVVMSNTELLLFRDDLVDEAREPLQHTLAVAERGAGIVRQILAFTRESSAPLGPLDLCVVVEAGVATIRAGLPAGIELVVDTDATTPPVMLSEAAVDEILTNLCANAARAIGDRPGRIEIKVGHAPVPEAAQDTADVPGKESHVRLTVTDNGAGIAPSTLKRIFEPFFSQHRDGQASGLGLSVVHGIVTGAGGTIEVASEPARGTTFDIVLPAAPRPASTAARPSLASAPRPPAPRPGRILYVDDEELLARVSSRLLEQFGYTVTLHTDPVAALDEVRRDPAAFDLVLTDSRMPVMSGTELAQSIAEIRRDLPVVMMSGFVDDALQQRAAAAGVREVVRKPAPARELERLTREHLARAHS